MFGSVYFSFCTEDAGSTAEDVGCGGDEGRLLPLESTKSSSSRPSSSKRFSRLTAVLIVVGSGFGAGLDGDESAVTVCISGASGRSMSAAGVEAPEDEDWAISRPIVISAGVVWMSSNAAAYVCIFREVTASGRRASTRSAF
jgi:hypothetical protein